METTVEEDIVTEEQAQPILLSQCDVVAARMRREGKKCTCVAVTWRTLDFKNRSHQCSLGNATDVTDEFTVTCGNCFMNPGMDSPSG